MIEARWNVLTLGALGMLSGAAVWGILLLQAQFGLDFELASNWLIVAPLTIFPSLVFGIVVGALAYHRGKVNGIGRLGYALAAGLAYFCATHVASDLEVTLFPTKGHTKAAPAGRRPRAIRRGPAQGRAAGLNALILCATFSLWRTNPV